MGLNRGSLSMDEAIHYAKTAFLALSTRPEV